MTPAQRKILLSPEVQAYIKTFNQRDLYDLILSPEKFAGLPNTLLAEQIKGHRKAAEKIPYWYEKPGLLYPPGKALEQCSSQAMASFKAGLMEGDKMVDLTGGTGVDSFFLGTKFQEVHYVEPDPELFQYTKYNLETFGPKHFHFHNQNAEGFLKDHPGDFDLIYLDPDRRPGGSNRKFLLEDTTPNVIQILDTLLNRSKRVMIKASPMLDIKDGIKKLGGADLVYVLGTEKECKELIFIISKNGKSLNPDIVAITLGDFEQPVSFNFDFETEEGIELKTGGPKHYIYDPYPTLLKSGAFKSLSNKFDMDKLHTNTHLYTSEELIHGFPGRVFKVIDVVKPNKISIEEKIPNGKAHSLIRNFPKRKEAFIKNLNLKATGEIFAIFTKDNNNKDQVIISKFL